MHKLPTTKKFVQITTCLKYIKSKYKANIDAYDLHNIFERLHISSFPITVNGTTIKTYKTDDVETALNTGAFTRQLNALTNHSLAKPKSFSEPPKQPDFMKRGRHHLFVNRPLETNVNKEEDFTQYRNDENDMEKYSEYLINNVYENIIDKVVKETINEILKLK